MSIYKLDDNGLPVLNDVSIGMTPEYKAIMRARRFSTGDADGRKKLQNRKELAFVWYFCDYKSSGIQQGMSGDELFEFARKEAGLPEGWKADELVDAAIKRYKRDSDTVVTRLNKNLLASFANSERTLNMLNRIMDTKLVQLETAVNNNSDDEEVIGLINFIVSTQKEILTISKELPDRIDQHTKYVALLNREQEDVKEGLGGSIIPNSAMPE